MRIMVITEEEGLYLPLSLERLMEGLGSEIVEVVCIQNIRHRNRIGTFLKFYRAFGAGPLLSHAFRLARTKVLNAMPQLNRTGRFFSVKRVCEKYGISYSFCDNVNAATFLDHCRHEQINLIAAISPSQIFKEELLTLPRYGCINIHSAKLPLYRGLYPTFWAMACGEKVMGITIHYMEKGIDTGKIILQEEIEIPEGTTLDYMLTVTKIKGAEMLIKAIQQIEKDAVYAAYGQGSSSYYSYPTPESYKQFLHHGYRLW